jgi:hemoglobin/transferrin/lactoferrin receptor protein
VRFDQYSLSGGGVSSSGVHVSPKLTIGVTPIQGFEIYGTYAEGYRAPSVTETLISGIHPFPAFTFLPNPNLLPEVAHNLEAGVNLKYNDVFRPGDTFRAKLTAFTNRVDNYIDIEQVGAPILTSFVPGFPNAACAGAPPGLCIPFQPFQYINVSKAQLDGVEAEGAYDWGGGVVSLAASAVNGKNLVDGFSLATVAPYRASTTIAFRFLDDKSLTLGARFTAVSASASNISPSATLPPSAGYGLVDLFGAYAYNDRVTGDLSVTNLFNKNYTPFLQSEPSPGLTVKAGLTIRLAAK